MTPLDELIFHGPPLLEKGGAALWAILLVSVAMWVLILERYWYLHLIHPRLRDVLLRSWRECDGRWQREALLHRLRAGSERYLGTIRVFYEVLPMLGLLGTVLGMIETFDVITVFGGGNVRGLAGGISQALLTTMAGLVTSLSGLYFSRNLAHRAREALDEADSLFNLPAHGRRGTQQ